MMRWKPWHALVAGVGIILVSNAVALLGAAWNRNGEPESRVVLSERELSLPYDWGMQRENSGIALHLRWRAVREKPDAYDFYAYQPLRWLDTAKLRELGFRLPPLDDTPASRRHYDKLLARDVLLVMEMNGLAYQASLVQVRDWAAEQQSLAARNPGNANLRERAERARERLRAEERSASRLFLVDAGVDVTTLRARYPDRGRYVILRGKIRPQLRIDGPARRVEGVVQSVDIDDVQVPEPYRQSLAPLLRRDGVVGDHAPRYSVTVAFGRRLEPWLVNVVMPAAPDS